MAKLHDIIAYYNQKFIGTVHFIFSRKRLLTIIAVFWEFILYLDFLLYINVM